MEGFKQGRGSSRQGQKAPLVGTPGCFPVAGGQEIQGQAGLHLERGH